MVGIVEGVTVNGFEAELDPWVALTVLGPLNDEGTIKEAENPPLLLDVGLATVVSPNFIVTAVVGAKPVPVTATGVPIGPDVTLRVMTGTVEAVTLNVLEAKLDPWVAVTELSPTEDDMGTLKVPIKVPVEVVFNGDGFVVTPIVPNLMVTSELGSKLIPATVTGLPPGPEVGSSTIIGFVEPLF